MTWILNAIVLFILLFYSHGYPTFDDCQACRKGEAYMKCCDKCEELQCPDVVVKTSTAKIKEGCFCAPGYSRNSHGQCVLTKDCRNGAWVFLEEEGKKNEQNMVDISDHDVGKKPSNIQQKNEDPTKVQNKKKAKRKKHVHEDEDDIDERPSKSAKKDSKKYNKDNEDNETKKHKKHRHDEPDEIAKEKKKKRKQLKTETDGDDVASKDRRAVEPRADVFVEPADDREAQRGEKKNGKEEKREKRRQKKERRKKAREQRIADHKALHEKYHDEIRKEIEMSKEERRWEKRKRDMRNLSKKGKCVDTGGDWLKDEDKCSCPEPLEKDGHFCREDPEEHWESHVEKKG